MGKIIFNHSKYLNPTLMMVICGPTNCGKTYLLFQMLTTPNILDFENLIIYTTTPEQNYFQFLKHGFENGLNKTEIQDLFNDNSDIDYDDIYECVSDYANDHMTTNRPNKIKVILENNKLVSPNEMNRKRKNLVIFDDCVNDKDQTIQQEYFTKGRHNSCSCIYLTQSFYGLDGQFIRRNANVFILFHLNKRNLSQVIQDVDTGDEDKFKQLAKKQFAKPKDHKYILINIEAPIEDRLVIDLFS